MLEYTGSSFCCRGYMEAVGLSTATPLELLLEDTIGHINSDPRYLESY